MRYSGRCKDWNGNISAFFVVNLHSVGLPPPCQQAASRPPLAAPPLEDRMKRRLSELRPSAEAARNSSMRDAASDYGSSLRSRAVSGSAGARRFADGNRKMPGSPSSGNPPNPYDHYCSRRKRLTMEETGITHPFKYSVFAAIRWARTPTLYFRCFLRYLSLDEHLTAEQKPSNLHEYLGFMKFK